MSDFAERLGKLKHAVNDKTDGVLTTSQKKRRRNQQKETTSDAEVPNKRLTSRPRDFQDLNVKVSFLCIGAQKSGTTWLHVMLKKLPMLCLPDQKEVHFWDWNRRKGLKWYSQQFPKRANSVLCGEITPCYAILDEAQISEVRSLFPDVKLIFMARDIVSRAWSAIIMELRNSVRGVQAGEFGNAGDSMDKRTKERYLHEADPSQYDDEYFMDRLMHATHRKRSDYASALRKWLEYFPKEQILLLNYDDVSRRPRKLLEEVLTFIGADNVDTQDFINDDELSTHFNAAPTESKMKQSIRPTLQKKMECYLSKYAKDFNDFLEELGYSWRLNDYNKVTK